MFQLGFSGNSDCFEIVVGYHTPTFCLKRIEKCIATCIKYFSYLFILPWLSRGKKYPPVLYCNFNANSTEIPMSLALPLC